MGTVKFSNPYQCPYHINFIMNIDIRCYNNNAKKIGKTEKLTLINVNDIPNFFSPFHFIFFY